jgi:hypothetical protein
VPGTIKKASYLDVGEVIICLGYDKRVRIFDGSDDQVISTSIERDNGLSPVYLDGINERQIRHCHAEVVEGEQVYRLWVVMTPSTDVTHAINLNLRTGAWYPYNQANVRAAVMAESAGANVRALFGVKKDGYVHWMDTGNTDAGTAIDEYYESPLVFGEAGPRGLMKGQRAYLYFSVSSSGTLYYQDKQGFTTVYGTVRDRINLVTGGNSLQIVKAIDVPAVQNAYQWRISSSASTAVPWSLSRVDYVKTDIGLGRP